MKQILDNGGWGVCPDFAYPRNGPTSGCLLIKDAT